MRSHTGEEAEDTQVVLSDRVTSRALLAKGPQESTMLEHVHL